MITPQACQPNHQATVLRRTSQVLEKEYDECQRMYGNYPYRKANDPDDFYKFIMYYRSHNLALRSERHLEFIKKNRQMTMECAQQFRKREGKLRGKGQPLQ